MQRIFLHWLNCLTPHKYWVSNFFFSVVEAEYTDFFFVLIDQLLVFDEELMSKKVPIKLRIGLELSHRHAAEFFGFYICRFVLADVSLLLDKFVKRGSEWVSQ
jgi:hypothetical protein